MLIYNMTFSVDTESADEWLTWMKLVHIPQAQKTGLFESYKILKVLSHDDTATVSFAVQYFVETEAILEKYFEKDAERLKREIQQRWGDRQIAYESLLLDVSP